MVLRWFWRSLTKKDSVKSAEYGIPVLIVFYFYSSFRTFFSRIRIFLDRIRIFLDRIRIFGRSGSGPREKVWSGSGNKTRIRNTDFNHCGFMTIHDDSSLTLIRVACQPLPKEGLVVFKTPTSRGGGVGLDFSQQKRLTLRARWRSSFKGIDPLF